MRLISIIKPKIFIKLTGGLGNQLFIYAFYLHIRKETGRQIVFDDREYSVSFRVNKLNFLVRNEIQYLKRQDQFILRPKIRNFLRYFGLVDSFIVVDEKDYFNNGKAVFNDIRNICFGGYWHHSYFVYSTIDEMKSIISLNDGLKKNDIYIKFLEQIRVSNSVSLHVRRSDYLSELNIDTYEILTSSYYEKAINKVALSDTHFFVFSDDLNWCVDFFSINFPSVKFEFIDLGDDLLEFDLMRNCKSNIIANSTFSLWAGLLNLHKDKIVIAPMLYYKNFALQDDYENNLRFDEFIYL